MAEIDKQIVKHNKGMVRAKPEFNMCDLAVQVRQLITSMYLRVSGLRLIYDKRFY